MTVFTPSSKTLMKTLFLGVCAFSLQAQAQEATDLPTPAPIVNESSPPMAGAAPVTAEDDAEIQNLLPEAFGE